MSFHNDMSDDVVLKGADVFIRSLPSILALRDQLNKAIDDPIVIQKIVELGKSPALLNSMHLIKPEFFNIFINYMYHEQFIRLCEKMKMLKDADDPEYLVEARNAMPIMLMIYEIIQLYPTDKSFSF